ncbi:MAG: hypothetical protein HYV23_07380 [Deltaproteobacteria bacterium]|nr:hypothetical protein [Deltaproteobacteria bacterium]
MKFFGADFFIWGLYDGLMVWSGSALLSAAFLVLGFTLFEALLFPLLAFLGFQSAVWWKFGTAETIGMPMLAALLLLSALGARRRSLLIDAAFTIVAIVLMLTKESFLVFIPAALFLKVWLEKRESGKGWFETAKLSALPVLVLLSWLGGQLLFIKFYVKSTGIGYAGYYGFHFVPFIRALESYLLLTQAWVIPAGLALAWSGWPDKGRKFVAGLTPLFIFLALALLPQALLHARSGVGERYLFPGAFATAFTAVFLMKLVRENMDRVAPASPARLYAGWAAAAVFIVAGAWTMRRGGLDLTFIGPYPGLSVSSVAAWLHHESGRSVFIGFIALLVFSAARSRNSLRPYSQKAFFGLLVAWAVVFNFTIAFDKATGSAFEGKTTSEWLSSIEKNTGKDDLIAVVADPAFNHEWAHSINMYLSVKMGRSNVHAYPVLTSRSYDPFHQTLIKSFGRSYKEKRIRGQDKLQTARAFVIFPGAETKFLSDASGWFRAGMFTRYVNESGFVSYYRHL